jgi:hypothetical protein
MKLLALMVILVTSLVAVFAQDSQTPSKRIYIEEYLRSGAIRSVNCATPGNCVGTTTGLRRDISLEATKGFAKNCPVVSVTDNR